MGMLIDGVWQTISYSRDEDSGRFIRDRSPFRDQISSDPESPFPLESGRYHLYLSLACPWAHRTLLYRQLLDLESHISVSVVDPYMGENGWAFSSGFEDPCNHYDFLHQAYTASDPSCTSRVTVPVLWDKQENVIVNNESVDIIRMMNDVFSQLSETTVDFYPPELREGIDEINDFLYPNINNGVYRCGFAGNQEAYEEAFKELFSALDTIEERLGQNRYLLGQQILECDWRLFTTLIRFDAVYYVHFKCNRNLINDFPNLSNYLRELYQVPGIAKTVNFDHIKQHYYKSHSFLNPTGIVPLGPVLNFSAPHNRAEILD